MRRILGLVGLAAIAFGVVFGAAASLNVNQPTRPLGASTQALTACSSSTAVSYGTTYDAATAAYVVESVQIDLSAAHTCLGQELALTFAKRDGSLTETGIVVGTGQGANGAFDWSKLASNGRIVYRPTVPIPAADLLNLALLIKAA